jgi:uncharacterized membrane protein
MLVAAASRSGFLLALAQGFSGLLAIAVAVLVFLAERTVRRHRTRDPTYRTNLILLLIASLTATLLSGLSWSSWALAAPHINLLFDWPVATWLALVFGGAIAVAAVCCIAAAWSLCRFTRRGHRANAWDP